MSEFMITEGTQAPLSALILSSWEEGLQRTRLVRAKREYRPFFKQAANYFQIQFGRYGIKRLGLIEAAISDPMLRELLTSPAVIGGKKRKPHLKKEELDPRRLLWLAVQLSGSPLERIDGKQTEGPGHYIPHMPLEMQNEWGANVGLLQGLTIMFNAGGKVSNFKWAQGQNMTLNASMRRFSEAHGLEDELRAWSDPNHEILQSRLEGMQEGILAYNQALKAMAANNNPAPQGPAAAMGELAGGSAPAATPDVASGNGKRRRGKSVAAAAEAAPPAEGTAAAVVKPVRARRQAPKPAAGG